MTPKSVTWFENLSNWSATIFGSPICFILSLLLVLFWLISGLYFHFSDAWQLSINTPTTIIELFAAITIQYKANRVDNAAGQEREELSRQLIAVHIKLDEMLRSTALARNTFMDIERKETQELMTLETNLLKESNPTHG